MQNKRDEMNLLLSSGAEVFVFRLLLQLMANWPIGRNLALKSIANG